MSASAASLAAVLLLALPGAARGADAPAAGFRSGPEVGLRAAVAPGFGSAAKEVPMEDAVSLQVPLGLEAGWRLGRLAAHAYGAWGPGKAPTCEPGSTCTATAARLGVEATWHFLPAGGPNPWVGLATGWERATASRRRAGLDDRRTFQGWELLQVEGGIDWMPWPRVALGPYLLLGFGRYSDVRVETAVESASAPLRDRAVHAWLHLGARVRLELGGPW